jgi:adhesin/invasin
VATSTITVTALDAESNPVSGVAVTLDVSGSDNTVSDPGSTDGSGVATATLSTTMAETKTITATVDGVELSTTVDVEATAGAVDADVSTVAAEPPSIAADGVAASTITVTALDAESNPVSGVAVTLDVSGSDNSVSDPGSTDGSGMATATLSTTMAATKTITATVDGVELSTTVDVEATAGVATQLLFAVQPTDTNGGGTITPAVEVAAADQFGNTDDSFTGTVTIGIGFNGGIVPGTLSGDLEVAAVNGVAVFSDLSIDLLGVGTDYTLVVTSGDLTAAESDEFDITAL